MGRSQIIGILTLVFFLLVSCQNEPKKADPAPQSQYTNKEEVPDVKKEPQKAAPFKRDPNRKAYSILTADLWHFNFALNVLDTPDENIFEGYWLDFEDDFTYQKGFYDKVVARGEYDYDNDTKILEMVPTEGDDEPSQWKIKTNGEVIILIGTSKYGNNATQIKLVRERERPKRD